MEAAYLAGLQDLQFTPVRYPYNRSPWGFTGKHRGTGGLDASHGCSWHGPVSEAKLKLEAKRLDSVRNCISHFGLMKAPGTDFINFRLIINDESPEAPDYRVVIVGGQHRVAYLAFMGWSIIPMVPASGPIAEASDREVRLSDLRNWPGVLDGTFSEEAARSYFLAFFRDSTSSLLAGW